MPQIAVRGPSGPPATYRFDQDTITIGRADTNDLSLLNATLSRRHAEIRRSGRDWFVADVGSRNGTFLNGRKVEEELALRPGDEITVGDVVLVFEAAAATLARTRETTKVLQGAAAMDAEPELVGSSPCLEAVRATIAKAAPSPATVLITGESGTGKELVARLIHRLSARRDGPFVVVNCPALPGSLVETELFGVERGVATGVDQRQGKLETANGGTLLLDEVGDLDPAAQAKLLRFLQDKTIERVGGRQPIPVDVRLLAATNHLLEAACARGAFREDLFHRLNVISIRMPPLRDRKADIPALVERFLAGTGKTMSAAALAALDAYRWPGNVRELQHVVERAAVLGENVVIDPEDLPESVRHAASVGNESTLGRRLETVELLWRRVVDQKESFWDVIQKPFLRREISREIVRELVARAYEATDQSYRGVARIFGIEEQHKKLLDFLRNHDLGVRR